jgi:hypothetical protein
MWRDGKLWTYGKRYFQTFFRQFGEFLLAQIVIAALLSGLVLWEDVRRGIISTETTKNNILALLWSFGYVIGLMLIWHLARTAYVMSLQDQAEIESLRKQIQTSEAENKKPKLKVEVWEVLLMPYYNSAEVFLDASVSNVTPGTQGTVRDYSLAIEIAGRRYPAGRYKSDLDNYRIIEVSDERCIRMVAPYMSSTLDDLADGINEKSPISFGVPHRGWLHFTLENLPDWLLADREVLEFERFIPQNGQTALWGSWNKINTKVFCMESVQAAILEVSDYFGSCGTFTASVKTEGGRRVIMM